MFRPQTVRALLLVGALITQVLYGQRNNAQLRLPAPSGRFAVGRASTTWTDFSRGQRPIKVDIWYPANARGHVSGRYFPDLDALLKNQDTKRLVTSHFGSSVPAMVAGAVIPNAQDDVEVSHAKPFPLLLFLPGLGASPYDYSIQLEELASRGYIVAGIEPLDDSLSVVLPSGKVVPFDEKLWARHQSPTSAEAVQFYEQRATLWAKDLIFALNRLTRATRDKDSRWYGAIDLRRIGAFGHSHGGRAAATACLLDPRISACLNEDGRLDEDQLQRPYWPITGKRIHGTFAMLDWFDPGLDQDDLAAMHTTLARYAMARLKANGAALGAYRDVSAGSYHLTLLLAGMQHTGFTDLPWLAANSKAVRSHHAEYLHAIRGAVVAFFDSSLKGEPTLLKNCGSTINGLLIQCYGESGRK